MWTIKNRNHIDEGSTAIVSEDPHKDNGGFVIAHTYGPQYKQHAYLIAAAPEMLEELKSRRNLCGCGHPACKKCRDDKRLEEIIQRAEP